MTCFFSRVSLSAILPLSLSESSQLSGLLATLTFYNLQQLQQRITQTQTHPTQHTWLDWLSHNFALYHHLLLLRNFAYITTTEKAHYLLVFQWFSFHFHSIFIVHCNACHCNFINHHGCMPFKRFLLCSWPSFPHFVIIHIRRWHRFCSFASTLSADISLSSSHSFFMLYITRHYTLHR